MKLRGALCRVAPRRRGAGDRRGLVTGVSRIAIAFCVAPFAPREGNGVGILYPINEYLMTFLCTSVYMYIYFVHIYFKYLYLLDYLD